MIIGHQKIWDYLQKSVTKNRVSHGYLFSGPEKIGKKKVAIEFAKILQCRESESFCGVCKNCQDIEKGIHPDLIFVQALRDSQEIEIAQIRDLRKTFSLSSYLGNYKMAIIDDAQNLNIAAANALLKTLEEPKGRAVLILISAFPHNLPKTIKSRLQQIKFSLVPNQILTDYLDQFGLTPSQRNEILKISQGRPGILQDILNNKRLQNSYKSFTKNLLNLGNFDFNERFEFARKIGENRGDSIKFLEGLTIFFRDIFLIKLGVNNFIINSFFEKELIRAAEHYSKNHLKKILKLIRKLSEMIFLSNVNSRLCLEVLMMEI